MVGVVEVNLGVEATLMGGIEEVVKEQERVAIFFCDLLKLWKSTHTGKCKEPSFLQTRRTAAP